MINEQTLQIDQEEQEERSSLNFSVIYRTLILYWKWFLLSIIICLGAAFLYLLYTKPRFEPAWQATGKHGQPGHD